jgi:hypothetical protein
MMRSREWVWAPLLIFVGITVGGLLAPPANATPADSYTALEWPVICKALSDNPSLVSVTSLFRAIIKDTGFSVEDTAKVVVQSVEVFCPENRPVLERFVRVYGGQSPVVAR